MEVLPRRGASWAKRVAFFQTSIQVALGGPSLFKKRAGDLRRAKFRGWRPDFIYTNVPLFVAQRRFFPPVPASPLLDVSGGPGFAQWIHVFGQTNFQGKRSHRPEVFVQDSALPLASCGEDGELRGVSPWASGSSTIKQKYNHSFLTGPS